MYKTIFNRKTTAADARALADRFMAGDSLPAEERRLYAFFSTNPAGSLPADLEAMRPMMNWYAAMQPAPAASSIGRLRIAGIAAALTVLVAAGVTLLLPSDNTDRALYARYEGSYIVRNGERIDDIAKIYASLEQAERTADSIMHIARIPDDDLDNATESYMIECALSTIGDEALASQIKHDILISDIHEKS